MRTRPPEDAQLEEMKQSGSCPLDAREVKLVDLLGGENPIREGRRRSADLVG
jgi:hypothetical protein